MASFLWISAFSFVSYVTAQQECGHFEQHLGSTLYGNNQKTLRDISVEQCKKECLAQTAFACISLDYNTQRDICYLSKESHETRPTNFGSSPGSDYYALVQCVTTTTTTTAATTTAATTTAGTRTTPSPGGGPPSGDNDCLTSALGTEYQGQISHTQSGRICQRWDEEYPHPHHYTDPDYFPDRRLADAENYCRNPRKTEDGGPWCLTTDPDTFWEYCDVECPDCADDTLLTDYQGQQDHARSGILCQRWVSNYPHTHTYYLDAFFPDNSVSDARNYCRNPVHSQPGGPWCFTTDPEVRWDYCAIPSC